MLGGTWLWSCPTFSRDVPANLYLASIKGIFDLLPWRLSLYCCCYLWLLNGILPKKWSPKSEDLIKWFKLYIHHCFYKNVTSYSAGLGLLVGFLFVFLIFKKAKLSVVTTAVSNWVKQADSAFFFLKSYIKIVGLLVCHTSSQFSDAAFAQFGFFSKSNPFYYNNQFCTWCWHPSLTSGRDCLI